MSSFIDTAVFAGVLYGIEVRSIVRGKDFNNLRSVAFTWGLHGAISNSNILQLYSEVCYRGHLLQRPDHLPLCSELSVSFR